MHQAPTPAHHNSDAPLRLMQGEIWSAEWWMGSLVHHSHGSTSVQRLILERERWKMAEEVENMSEVAEMRTKNDFSESVAGTLAFQLLTSAKY